MTQTDPDCHDVWHFEHTDECVLENDWNAMERCTCGPCPECGAPQAEGE